MIMYIYIMIMYIYTYIFSTSDRLKLVHRFHPQEAGVSPGRGTVFVGRSADFVGQLQEIPRR